VEPRRQHVAQQPDGQRAAAVHVRGRGAGGEGHLGKALREEAAGRGGGRGGGENMSDDDGDSKAGFGLAGRSKNNSQRFRL
jgi:hypothetical protein